MPAPGDLPPGDLPPGDLPPGDLPPGDLPPGDLPPGDLPPGDLPPGDLPPGDLAPGDLAPGDLAPGDLAPGDLAPGDVAPGDLPPGDLPPGDLAPGDLAPGDVAPGDLPPGDVAPGNVAEAVRNVHEYFERASGWSPPSTPTLAEWLADGVCRSPDDCLVVPDGWCAHGLASWWLVLLDERRAAGARWDPALLLPHPDRLDLRHPGAGAAVEAHEAAVHAGEAGYPDPGTGLWVMTARALWERGTCCASGCRHCPWLR